MADRSSTVAAAAEQIGGVDLPGNIQLLDVIGEGSRAVVFRARFREEDVALKVYRPEVAKRYRDKHDVNIAVYEMSENRKFRKVQELFPFSAKPLMVLGHGGKHSLCFMQELIDGMTLERLANAEQGLPSSVLEAGEVIARAAEQAEITGLDLDYHKVLARKQAGRWLPVIHDFNAPPGGDSGGSLMGLFRKSRDRSYLAMISGWRELASRE